MPDEADSDRRFCKYGCVDYHVADCPYMTFVLDESSSDGWYDEPYYEEEP